MITILCKIHVVTR